MLHCLFPLFLNLLLLCLIWVGFRGIRLFRSPLLYACGWLPLQYTEQIVLPYDLDIASFRLLLFRLIYLFLSEISQLSDHQVVGFSAYRSGNSSAFCRDAPAYTVPVVFIVGEIPGKDKGFPRYGHSRPIVKGHRLHLLLRRSVIPSQGVRAFPVGKDPALQRKFPFRPVYCAQGGDQPADIGFPLRDSLSQVLIHIGDEMILFRLLKNQLLPENHVQQHRAGHILYGRHLLASCRLASELAGRLHIRLLPASHRHSQGKSVGYMIPQEIPQLRGDLVRWNPQGLVLFQRFKGLHKSLHDLLGIGDIIVGGQCHIVHIVMFPVPANPAVTVIDFICGQQLHKGGQGHLAFLWKGWNHRFRAALCLLLFRRPLWRWRFRLL